MTKPSAWDIANNVGNILLRQGSITSEQLIEAAKTQAERRARLQPDVALGELCVALGFCDMVALDRALQEQRRNLAPACNEGEAQKALADMDRAVRRQTKSSSRLQAVTRSVELASVGDGRSR